MPKKKKKQGREEIVGYFERAWFWVEARWKSVLLVFLAASLVFTIVLISVNAWNSRRAKIQLEFMETMKISDDSGRILKLTEFAKKHSGGEVACLANMWLGAYYYEKGNFDEASKFYEKVITDAKGDAVYFMAIDALTPVLADMGEFSKGALLFLEGAKLGSNPKPYLSKYNAGLFYQWEGEYGKASEIYEDLMANEETPASTKLKAEEQLLWISTLVREKEAKTQ